MAAPIINSKTPGVSATGVYLDANITIVFDQAITSATRTDSHFIIYRTSDFSIIDKTITYDSDTFTVTLNPDKALDDTTTFNIVVDAVANSASQTISDNWVFTTGTDLTPIVETEAPSAQPETPVADAPVEKVLEVGESSSFIITDTTPDNYDSNIGTLNGDDTTVTWGGPIVVTLNRTLPPASGIVDHQDWLTLSAEVSDGDAATPTSTPSGVLTRSSDTTLTWTPPTYGANTTLWSANNQITVTVSSDVEDYEYNTLGCDYQFMFSTQYYPFYCTVKKIRAQIGPYIRDVSDEAISIVIYQNSLEAYNLANVVYAQAEWSMDDPTFAAKQWTCCKTQHDILQAKLLDAAADGAGQMKRLGDFTVQEGLDLQKSIQGALDKAAACASQWLKLVLGKSRRAKARAAVKGIANPAVPPIRGVRTWDLSGNGVGSNKRRERTNKSPGVYDDWS